ncbi:MAG: hypothetical protein ACI9Z4_002434 [Polaribacter sp.]
MILFFGVIFWLNSALLKSKRRAIANIIFNGFVKFILGSKLNEQVLVFSSYKSFAKFERM